MEEIKKPTTDGQNNTGVNGADNASEENTGPGRLEAIEKMTSEEICNDDDLKALYTDDQIEGMHLFVNLADELSKAGIDIKPNLIATYGGEKELKAVPVQTLMEAIEREGMKLAPRVYNTEQIRKINDYLNVEATKKCIELFKDETYDSLSASAELAVDNMSKVSHENITTHIETTTTIRRTSSSDSSSSSSSDTNWLEVAFVVTAIGLLCYGGYKLYERYSEEADLIVEAMPDINMSEALDIADSILEDSLF